MSLSKTTNRRKAKFFYSLKDVEKKLHTKIPESLSVVEKEYPVLVSEYYLGLINRNNISDDPIWKQCIPNARELNDSDSNEDPLYEKKYMPVPKLIHRYKDRALLLTTTRCTTQCRFCLRKRYWKQGTTRQDIDDNELKLAVKYLKARSEIKEVLLSGGDPLVLSNSKLDSILKAVYSTETIEVVRIASRVPVTNPSRINSGLMKIFSKYDGIWFVTHFNHPNEVTPESMAACKKIISSGIPILNQTVLLKGINDNPVVLEELFRILIKNKIKPHYLFHLDPVRGVQHFATGVEKGLEILRYFRKNLSSIATPHFSIDLPEGGGKVSLQPTYSKDGISFESVNGKRIITYYPELKNKKTKKDRLHKIT